jgi:hypothetical protein
MVTEKLQEKTRSKFMMKLNPKYYLSLFHPTSFFLRFIFFFLFNLVFARYKIRRDESTRGMRESDDCRLGKN